MLLVSAPQPIPPEIVSVEDVPCRLVKVPSHIWRTLALQAGMPSYAILNQNAAGRVLNEVICTTVPQRDWTALWNLKLSLQDDTGLLSELTVLLKEFGINIVSCRAVTREPRGLVQFEILLDAYNYTVHNPERLGRSPQGHGETLPQVRAHIIGTFIRQLEFHNEVPVLGLRRVLPLMLAQRQKYGDDPEELPLQHRRIPVPLKLLRTIQASTAADFPDLPRTNDAPMCAAVAADTEAGALRLLVLFPGTRHLALRFHHRDRVGTLAEIAARIAEQNWNMLQVHTHRTRDREGNGSEGGAATEVIVSVPDALPGSLSRAELEVMVARLLEKGEPITSCSVTWGGND